MATLTILGISPRNPYYNGPNIEFALSHLTGEKRRTLIFIPDGPDVNNYLAYGYDAAEARRKADDAGHIFRKTIHEICARRGYGPERLRINDWYAEVENHPAYRESLRETEDLYRTSDAFRQDARTTSLASLQSRMKQDQKLQCSFNANGIETGIGRAVRYLIWELAFLDAAPVIFDCEHADYVYHRAWPAYEKFIAGTYDGRRRPALGFRIITNPAVAPA